MKIGIEVDLNDRDMTSIYVTTIVIAFTLLFSSIVKYYIQFKTYEKLEGGPPIVKEKGP